MAIFGVSPSLWSIRQLLMLRLGMATRKDIANERMFSYLVYARAWHYLYKMFNDLGE
jgi:hypothetical protein